MEADAADIEFKDGQFRVVGTDKAITHHRCRQGRLCADGSADGEIRRRAGSDRQLQRQSAEPSKRLACLRARSRSANRRSGDRPLFCRRRSRPRAQSADRARPNPRRRGAGNRPGAAGASGLRPAIRQLLSGSFMDYGMPRADTMPNVDAELEEIPCKTNPLGVKGIGESGTIGAPPTVINALHRCA